MSPMVLDYLNFVHNVKHHYRALGGWSWALKDYYELNFTSYIDRPELVEMMEIVDPLVYKDIF